jgi:hypothetical protein
MNAMSGKPLPSGACCLPGAEGLSYIRIGPKQHTVGMMNLEMVFRQLFALGRLPEEVSDDEVVGMARRFNYIAQKPAVEADYADALRQAYAAFYARQEDVDESAER